MNAGLKAVFQSAKTARQYSRLLKILLDGQLMDHYKHPRHAMSPSHIEAVRQELIFRGLL